MPFDLPSKILKRTLKMYTTDTSNDLESGFNEYALRRIQWSKHKFEKKPVRARIHGKIEDIYEASVRMEMLRTAVGGKPLIWAEGTRRELAVPAIEPLSMKSKWFPAACSPTVDPYLGSNLKEKYNTSIGEQKARGVRFVVNGWRARLHQWVGGIVKKGRDIPSEMGPPSSRGLERQRFPVQRPTGLGAEFSTKEKNCRRFSLEHTCRSQLGSWDGESSEWDTKNAGGVKSSMGYV
ncbi:hypothetical protein BD410DRAFT_865593 [Rickenella mellea]|uniref:Uncharacterized protein n=1 Tax=Rickenella mellea TaxID=50990 RepID=A0A4Y7PFR7_9AGAM|nr:hypothetical protein BD410DRAFT_865593 [Rickenella mellea]